MSDWDKTRNGKEMMETIIRYLPRITVCLEQIAISLKPKDEFNEDPPVISIFTKDNGILDGNPKKKGCNNGM